MSVVTTVGVVHVHSDFSHDGRDAVERIRDLAAARGVRFVAMSDHAEDLDAARYAELQARCAAASRDDVQVIAGLEFRFAGFKGLHLLALGLRHWISPRTPSEFAAVAPTACGLTVVAHPGLAGYRVPLDVVEAIDAIEVWNAAYNTRYLPDPRAIDLLRSARRVRAGIVGVAGLDQHDAANDRQTRVVVEGATDGDPLAALKAGRFRNRGRTLAFGPDGEWPAAGMTALRMARGAFDVIERAQDRWARSRAQSRKAG